MELTSEQRYAGTTWSFTESYSDYLASDGWTLNIILQHKPDAGITLTSVVSGDDFVFTIPVATTETLTARTYTAQAIASQTGEVEIVETTTLEIIPIGTIAGDYRTHNEIMLDAITAMEESRATREQKSLKFADRELEYLEPLEIIKWRDYYQAKVNKENRIAAGKSAVPRLLERY